MSETRPLIGYSGLTGTVYVLKRNGQKEAVPEAQVVAVITGWLDDHDLVVTKPDGTRVTYFGSIDIGTIGRVGPETNAS